MPSVLGEVYQPTKAVGSMAISEGLRSSVLARGGGRRKCGLLTRDLRPSVLARDRGRRKGA